MVTKCPKGKLTEICSHQPLPACFVTKRDRKSRFLSNESANLPDMKEICQLTKPTSNKALFLAA